MLISLDKSLNISKLWRYLIFSNFKETTIISKEDHERFSSLKIRNLTYHIIVNKDPSSKVDKMTEVLQNENLSELRLDGVWFDDYDD